MFHGERMHSCIRLQKKTEKQQKKKCRIIANLSIIPRECHPPIYKIRRNRARDAKICQQLNQLKAWPFVSPFIDFSISQHVCVRPGRLLNTEPDEISDRWMNDLNDRVFLWTWSRLDAGVRVSWMPSGRKNSVGWRGEENTYWRKNLWEKCCMSDEDDSGPAFVMQWRWPIKYKTPLSVMRYTVISATNPPTPPPPPPQH